MRAITFMTSMMNLGYRIRLFIGVKSQNKVVLTFSWFCAFLGSSVRLPRRELSPSFARVGESASDFAVALKKMIYASIAPGPGP